MRQWNETLLAACDSYPMMRVYDWSAHAKPRWFIPDKDASTGSRGTSWVS